MTDFRAKGTIMGPAGLTAVFGMGTGVTPPVSSPEIGRREDQSRRPRWIAPRFDCRSHTLGWQWPGIRPTGVDPDGSGIATPFGMGSRCPDRAASIVRGGDESGWSSLSAVRTGRLRRSPVVHSRPIDLVVFQEPSHRLVPETSSRRGLRA